MNSSPSFEGGLANMPPIGMCGGIAIAPLPAVARGKPFTRSDYKKAIVTLEEGQQIDVTTGL